MDNFCLWLNLPLRRTILILDTNIIFVSHKRLGGRFAYFIGVSKTFFVLGLSYFIGPINLTQILLEDR